MIQNQSPPTAEPDVAGLIERQHPSTPEGVRRTKLDALIYELVHARETNRVSEALLREAVEGLRELNADYQRALGLAGYTEDRRREVESALAAEQKAREEAEKLIYAPGVMRCAKCKFRLIRSTLHVNTGAITAGDSETEACPNGCGPLWPVTWREEARAADENADKLLDRAQASEARASTAEAALTAAWHEASCCDDIPLGGSLVDVISALQADREHLRAAAAERLEAVRIARNIVEELVRARRPSGYVLSIAMPMDRMVDDFLQLSDGPLADDLRTVNEARRAASIVKEAEGG